MRYVPVAEEAAFPARRHLDDSGCELHLCPLTLWQLERKSEEVEVLSELVSVTESLKVQLEAFKALVNEVSATEA